MGVQTLFECFGEGDGAEGIEGEAKAVEGAIGEEGVVAGEEGEGRVEIGAREGGGGGRGGRGLCCCIKDGAGGSDPERGGWVGFKEAMDQPLTPDGKPSCDMLPPGEEAKTPFLGVAHKERGQG